MRFALPDIADIEALTKSERQAVARQETKIWQAFREHNERIRPLLPSPLQQLQKTDLHDGLIRSVRISPGDRSLRLRLLCGDLCQGYFDLTLDYSGILLTSEETSLLCLIARETTAGATGINRNEVDLSEGQDNPPFIHRISWNTGVTTGRVYKNGKIFAMYTLEPELELRFSSLKLHVAPRSDRRLVRRSDFITIVRDEELRPSD